MKPREAHQSELVLRNFGNSLEAGWGFPGGLVVKNPPANAGDTGDTGSIPESGRSPGEGHDNPLQYSCLENPMDREAQQVMVQGVEACMLWQNGVK